MRKILSILGLIVLLWFHLTAPVSYRADPGAKNLEIDRQTILQEGRLARQFSEYEATGHRMEASAYRTKGRYAMLAGFGEAGGTALTRMGVYKRNF